MVFFTKQDVLVGWGGLCLVMSHHMKTLPALTSEPFHLFADISGQIATTIQDLLS